MWWLILFFTFPHEPVELKEYPTQAMCEQEKARVMIEMIATVPDGIVDYRLVCKYKPKST